MARSAIVKAALIDWQIPSDRVSVYLPPYSREFFHCEYLLPTEPDNFNIVFLGRLVQLKGVFDLIAMHKKVLEEAPSAHLFIVGSGPERASMEQQVSALGIGRAITFLGEVPQKDVYGYLAPADIAVLPSHQEGLGKTAVEALLSGLPVLATEGTGFGEYIENDYNGYLIPKGDIDGFANAIIGLIADPVCLATLRENALTTRNNIMANSLTFETAITEYISSISNEKNEDHHR